VNQVVFGLLFAWLALGAAQAQERKNWFNDPFMQVTSAIPNCPAPREPGITREEMAELAHIRAQHGTSCHLSGRCRLANSYLYDKEIIPRVVQYIRLDGRFDNTSVWVLGERRLVTLMGAGHRARKGRRPRGRRDGRGEPADGGHGRDAALSVGAPAQREVEPAAFAVGRGFF
jgi:hypothetical protein